MINIKNIKKGFTLVEVIIASLITVILLMFIFAVLNNFIRSRQTVRRLDLLQDTATLAFNTILQDIHWSDGYRLTKGLEDETERKDVLELDLGDPAGYEHEFKIDGEGRFLKDGVVMSSDEVMIKSFRIENLAENLVGDPEIVNNLDGIIPYLKVEMSFEYIGPKPKVVYEDSISISFRKDKIAIGE